MKNPHLRRILIVLAVFGLLFLLDQSGEFGWMKRAPLLFGVASALLGLMISRRLENNLKKKSSKA